jgi:hypothetical protein
LRGEEIPVIKGRLLKQKEAAINLELKKIGISIACLTAYRVRENGKLKIVYDFYLNRVINKGEYAIVNKILKKHLGEKGGAR